jgi:PKD repeat protein/subtilisin-like proprotein convertase family protein
MKQKVLCVLFFCLFINNLSVLAGQDKYLKLVAKWKDYAYSPAFDIDVDNNILYIGVDNEIRIHDANDLSDSTSDYTITFQPKVYDLQYSDGYLYICNDDFGFYVYDVTNLDQPVVVYRDEKCEFAKTLHANDMYVIVVCNNLLSIYKKEPPNTIQLKFRTHLADLSNIKSVHIHEKYLFIVDQDEGIFIYNFKEFLSRNFQPIEQYDNHSDIKHLLIKDQVAYISDRDIGFSIVDVSIPEIYQEYACIDTIHTAVGSVIVEQYAYVVTHETRRIWVFDIEDKNNILEIEACDLDYDAYHIHAGNDHIFVSGHSHMYIYQLTQGFPDPQFEANNNHGDAPLNVVFTNTSSGDLLACKWNFGDGYTSTENSPVHIYTQAGQYTVTLAVSNGDKWYTKTKANYISVTQAIPNACFQMDFQTRVCPLHVQFTQKSSGNYTAVYWNFGDGYTSTAMEPLHVFTRTGLYNVTLSIFAMNDSFQYSRPVSVFNNIIPLADWTAKPVYAFCTDTQKKYGFAAGLESIDVLNISNPMAISIIGTIPMRNPPESLFYTQNYLFVVCEEDGLFILNTSNPTRISVISKTKIDSKARHIWIEDSYAYISTDAGIFIYNLTAISSPSYITTIETSGEAYALKKFDQYAFIADVKEGLSCYKQENDLDFFRPNKYKVDNLVQFDFDMDYLFLAVRETGMIIIQYDGTGDRLMEIGSVKQFNAIDICVRNDYAFVASDQDGFSVINVQDKLTPKPIERFYSTGSACDVVDVYPYIFLANGDAGLRIFVQPEQNHLQMRTPRIINVEHSYQGEVCLPYAQKETLTIDLQANEQIEMIDESVRLTGGCLCQNFSFAVKTKSEDLQSIDPQTPFKASAKGWFDANSYSFITDNELIKTYSANDLPLRIPDEQFGISVINIPDEGTIQCLSIQLRIKIKKLDDLRVTLITPHDNNIKLLDKVNPGEYDDTMEINLDDRADLHISKAKIPLAGFYQPENSFSCVKNKSTKGEWLLYIEDNSRYNSAQLLSWSMFFELSGVNTHPLSANQEKARFVITDHNSTKTKKNQQVYTKPMIQLLDVPSFGNRIQPITGIIHNVVNFSGYISVYILTDSWHLKPRINAPITNYDNDGRWQCDITTKWGDEKATKIAVFLFSRDRQPLLMPDFPVLPQSFFQKAIFHKIVDRRK